MTQHSLSRLAVFERQVLVGIEGLLYSRGWQPGAKVDSYPSTTSAESAGLRKFLKGKRSSDLSESLR